MAFLEIDTAAPPSDDGCLECDASGSWWLHLRRCAACGHVGCCDSSLNRHARRHFEETGHPIIQSFEPGEDWFYNWRSDEAVGGEQLTAPTSHPRTQTTPGPAERVPSDWERLLDEASREQ